MLMQPQSSRRNPTKLFGAFDAGTICVCRVDDKVALHIYTTDGELLVRMRERDFIIGCRGPHDANGNPLRQFSDLDEDTRRQIEAAHLARVHEQEMHLGLSPESVAKCEEAWRRYLADQSLSQRGAAIACGIAPVTFNVWTRHHKPEEAKAERLARNGAGTKRHWAKRRQAMPIL